MSLFALLGAVANMFMGKVADARIPEGTYDGPYIFGGEMYD